MKKLFLFCLLLLGGVFGAAAQTSTGRLQGTVTDSTGSPAIGAAVMARNVQTGFSRGAAAGVNGFYSLPGLQPGTYEVTVSLLGFAGQKRSVQLGIGQVVEFSPVLRVETTQLEGVVVTATRLETRTPEVATNITTEQINNLPLADRNFLNLATLAPGIRTQGGSISAGGLSANNINVFIDGASFKSDVLTGGVAGQDASRGNPFPQNAIQEFRVITQQFKAEYQKASSAIITARTKSGGNQFSGGAFLFFQNKALVGQDYLSKVQLRSVQEKPDYARYQAGVNLGGPIIRDKLNFFLSYEGNYQDRFNTVSPGRTDNSPAQFESYRGTFKAPFRSNLFFGKLSFQPTQKHLFELSANVRNEFEYRDFGGLRALDKAENFNNDVNTFILKHQLTLSDRVLNEAQVSFQRYRWNPVPLDENVGQNFSGVVEIGGRGTLQEFVQDRLALRNDLTYTVPDWVGSHVFKGGVTLDLLDYQVSKQLDYIPQFFYPPNAFNRPDNVRFGFGNPDIGTQNTQVGAYFQDDWTLARRLTLNLGVRWDYETNMINNDYVTPAEVRQTVTAAYQGVPAFFNPQDYFSDGNNRKPFANAFQPRVGFSYDLLGNGTTTLFGGWGVYFDRIVYNDVLDERFRLQWQTYQVRFSENGGPDPDNNPTVAWEPRYLDRAAVEALVTSGTAGEPEVFLIRNDARPPKSYQSSIGVRQTLGDVLLTLSYSNVRGFNNLTYFFGNRRNTPDVAGFSNVLVSNQDARSWYDGVFLKLEKNFTPQSRWGAQLAYTLSWSDIEADGTFGGLAYLSPQNYERFRSPNDERHRIVANAILGLPLGFTLSGLATFGTGTPYSIFLGEDLNNDGIFDNDFPAGLSRNAGQPRRDPFIFQNVFAFRNVDLRLEKTFTFREKYRLGFTLDAFNIFNYVNFNAYEGNLSSPNFGRPYGVLAANNISSARSIQFGIRTEF